MRPYRGKRIDNGEWVYGWYFEVGKDSFILNNPCFRCVHLDIINDGGPAVNQPLMPVLSEENFVKVDPKTVGQQTGLKNKNGKEGYQDDIALCSDGEYGLIVWKNAGWYLKRTSKSHTWSEGYYSYMDLSYCVGTLGFVGNIHDNPELLKEQK